jgi:hypothetical protein
MSRLIADNDGAMPSRYAFNNDKSAIMILQFKKASSYDGANQCNTTCGEHTFSGTGSEDW